MLTLGQAMRYASVLRRHRTFEPDDLVPHVPEPRRLRLQPIALHPLLTAYPAAGVITSGFGMRHRPILGGFGMHMGTDIAARVGTPVMAPAAGRVQFVGQQRGYGLVVILDHGAGRQTVYAHLSAANVTVGGRVEAGDAIAAVGRSGRVTGAHLHYEVRQDGKAVNPGLG